MNEILQALDNASDEETAIARAIEDYNVEEIAEAVVKLPPDQFARFRRWFIAFSAAAQTTPRNSAPPQRNSGA